MSLRSKFSRHAQPTTQSASSLKGLPAVALIVALGKNNRYSRVWANFSLAPVEKVVYGGCKRNEKNFGFMVDCRIGKFFLSEKTAIDGVVGFGSGFMAHFDYLWHNFESLKVNEGKLPYYYGGGFLISEKDFCVQGKIGLEYLFDTNPLGIFIEIAPAIGTDFIFQGGVGVRYRLK